MQNGYIYRRIRWTSSLSEPHVTTEVSRQFLSTLLFCLSAMRGESWSYSHGSPHDLSGDSASSCEPVFKCLLTEQWGLILCCRGQSHRLSGVQLDSFPSCQLSPNCPTVTSPELFSRQISSPVISILDHLLTILRPIQSLYKQALTFSSSRYLPLPLTMSTLARYPDPLHSFPSLPFFFHLDQGGLVFPSVSSHC